jgi:hypothetical protein
MDCQAPLIYRGRIIADDVSELDLLRWTGHGYFAGDTKSGAGEEGRGGAGRTALFGLKCGWQSEGLTIETANYLLRPR